MPENTALPEVIGVHIAERGGLKVAGVFAGTGECVR